MDTIDKLESMLHSFVEAHESLCSDAAETAGRSAGALDELERAREKIQTLEQTVRELEGRSERYKDFEGKKALVLAQLRTIIEKLNKIHD